MKILNFSTKTVDGKVYTDRFKPAVQISWEYGDTEYVKVVKDFNTQRFIASLSPSHEEIIIVFKGFKEFLPPNNAVLLNPDGSIRKQLFIPNMRSQEYQHYTRSLPTDIQNNVEFLQPHIDRQNRLTVWVGFGHNYFFEIHELNPTTGEFGEYLGTSRL